MFIQDVIFQDEDKDLERIDLDALKRLESPKKVNPLQAHREEEPIKPPER